LKKKIKISLGSLKKIVKILIEHGADVNAIDKNGWSPLHFASNEGHLAVCELLLLNGANAALKTTNGSIALHYIAQKAGVGFEDPLLYRRIIPLMIRQGYKSFLFFIQKKKSYLNVK
jgi:ankyrin repeat protein